MNLNKSDKGIIFGLIITIIQIIITITTVSYLNRTINNYTIISLIISAIIIIIAILGLKFTEKTSMKRNLYIVAGVLAIVHMSILSIIAAIGFLYSAYEIEKESKQNSKKNRK